MTLDEVIKRFTSNAEYERTHGSLQGCLEFRQLAEWLKDYKRLLEQEPSTDAVSRQALRMIDEIKTEIENLPTDVELTDGSIREFAFKNYKKGLLKIIDEKVKENKK